MPQAHELHCYAATTTIKARLACPAGGRRLGLHSRELPHREALRRAETLALSLARELEQTAKQWPKAAGEAVVASRRSY